jgi:hypothetical protein
LIKLRTEYSGAPVWLKPALIEYIWNRADIPKVERMSFMADVIAKDKSLNAVEYAGRYLSDALDVKLKPLAVKVLLKVWREKKDSIETADPTQTQPNTQPN